MGGLRFLLLNPVYYAKTSRWREVFTGHLTITGYETSTSLLLTRTLHARPTRPCFALSYAFMLGMSFIYRFSLWVVVNALPFSFVASMASTEEVPHLALGPLAPRLALAP